MDEIRQAIEQLPVSGRALARRAGISHALLHAIRAGERSLTPAVAVALADALEEMGAECRDAAERIRNVSEGER